MSDLDARFLRCTQCASASLPTLAVEPSDQIELCGGQQIELFRFERYDVCVYFVCVVDVCEECLYA